MSVKVMTAVFDRYPNGGGEMVLALALADHAHEDGSHVYPSVAALAEKTRQSARTVQYQLRRMEEQGWLILVGAGNGGRGMAREYKISPDWLKGADFAGLIKGANGDIKGAIYDEKGAIHDIKGANQRTKGCNPLHPHITVRTVIEPNTNTREPARDVVQVEDFGGLDVQGVAKSVWQDFAKLRKAKKAAITQTAIDAIRTEAQKAGMTLEDALRTCCRQGWAGFKADWVRGGGGVGAASAVPGETAYQRSMRRRYEESVGLVAADAPHMAHMPHVIDMGEVVHAAPLLGGDGAGVRA